MLYRNERKAFLYNTVKVKDVYVDLENFNITEVYMTWNENSRTNARNFFQTKTTGQM